MHGRMERFAIVDAACPMEVLAPTPVAPGKL
jgi:hypothetical protein